MPRLTEALPHRVLLTWVAYSTLETDVRHMFAFVCPFGRLFARFDPSKNVAPKKFFERMKADLLKELLAVMVTFINDEARSNLVAGIIAVVETSGPALEARLVEEYGADKAAKVMDNLLITEATQARQKVLSPQDIRQRLEQLREQES